MCNYAIDYVNCPKGPYRVKKERQSRYHYKSTPHVYQVACEAGPAHPHGVKSVAYCEACKAAHDVRFVKAKFTHAVQVERAGADAGKCDERCLRGKRICNCKCMGRCHGAGFCSCGLPSTDRRVAA